MSEKQPAPPSSGVSPYVPRSPSAPRQYRDLCSTCNHAGTCDPRSTAEHPIFFCEMFEAFVPASVVAPTTTGPERQANPAGMVGLKGLCINCEHRESCSMHRPEGGIWHCEEYR